MTLLLSLLRVDALLGGALAVLHGLEHLLGILLAHAALLLLFLLILFILILILVLLILVLVLILIFVFVLILILVLILVFVFVLILILIFVLVLVVLVFVFVLVLLLLFELSQTQVLTCLIVIGIATQGMLVELDGLAIVLTAIGDVAQVIAGLAAQLLVLGSLGQISEQSLGLLHRVLVIVFLGCDAALSHEGGGEIELRFLARGVGLQSFAVFDLGLGIALFLIQFVAVAQGDALLLGHLGRFALGCCRESDKQGQGGYQYHCQRCVITSSLFHYSWSKSKSFLYPW